MKRATFLIASGGTGGHVLPGIEVARELRARGHECVFVGTSRGQETRLVPAAGFALELLETGALKGCRCSNVSRPWRACLRVCSKQAACSIDGVPGRFSAWAATLRGR